MKRLPEANRRGLRQLFAAVTLIGVGFAFGQWFPRRPQETPLISAQPGQALVSKSSAPDAPRWSQTVSTVSTLDRLRALMTTSGANIQFDLSEAILLIRQFQISECRVARPLLQRINRNDREILADALAGRWAYLDPADAFDNAQATRRDNDWSNRIGYAAGAALAAADPNAALDRITSARNNDLREKAAEWVLPALARSQGRLAAEYLSANSLLTRHEHIYRTVAWEFGRSSPEEAISWANSISNQRLRDSSVTIAWAGWAEFDPQVAASALNNHPEMKENRDVISALARSWSRSDLQSAFAWIESIPDLEMRSHAFRSTELQISQLSSGEARELLLKLPTEEIRGDFAAGLAQQYAQQNIHEALSWAENLPADKGRARALASIMREWAVTDPASAVHYLDAQPESNERSENLVRVISAWIQSDSNSAYEFVQAMPSGPEKEAATAKAIENIAGEAPEKALEMFQSLTDYSVVEQLAPSFVGSLVRTDPAAALGIASLLPAESQPDAYHSLVRGWAFDHPKEAGAWLNTLPPGDPRDSAVKAYVSVIDGMDAALATKWALSIQEPTERMETTLHAFNRWIRSDKSAARAWVEQAAVPEGFRPYLDRILKEQE